MSLTTTNKLIKALDVAAEVLGPDATLRQLSSFLYVSQAGSAGIDGITLERHSRSSQAATSRNLRLLGPTLGLAEFVLDQNDGRRRLARLLPKGEQLVERMISAAS